MLLRFFRRVWHLLHPTVCKDCGARAVVHMARFSGGELFAADFGNFCSLHAGFHHLEGWTPVYVIGAKPALVI